MNIYINQFNLLRRKIILIIIYNNTNNNTLRKINQIQ